ARSVFGQEPIFVALLRARGLEYRFDPVTLSLERTGVSAVMNRRFARAALDASAAELEQVLATVPDWLVVTRERDIVGVVRPPALAEAASAGGGRSAHEALEAALHAAPRVVVVPPQATLREAMQRLDAAHAELALVCEGAAAGTLEGAHAERVRG